MAQKIREVLVRGPDGQDRKVALIRTEGNVAYVCSLQRSMEAPAAEIEEWLVGFPLAEVRRANGKPLSS